MLIALLAGMNPLILGWSPVVSELPYGVGVPTTMVVRRPQSWMSPEVARMKPDGEGRLLYVLDDGAKTVFIFDRQGVSVGQITGFGYPSGIAVGPTGWLYAIDGCNIDVFKRGATKPFRILSDGSSCDEYPPSGVSVGVDGSAYTIPYFDPDYYNVVYIYAPGSLVPTKTVELDEWYQAEFVTTDARGAIYVSVLVYSFYEPILVEFTPKAYEEKVLPADFGNAAAVYGLDVTASRQLVACDGTQVLTFRANRAEPVSAFAAPCTDITLNAADDELFAVTGIERAQAGTTLTRYTYPGGKQTLLIHGFQNATGVAVDGGVTD